MQNFDNSEQQENGVPNWIAGTVEYVKARDSAAKSYILAEKIGKLGKTAMNVGFAVALGYFGIQEMASHGLVTRAHEQLANSVFNPLAQVGWNVALGGMWLGIAVVVAQEIRYRLALKKAVGLIVEDDQRASVEMLAAAGGDQNLDSFSRLIAIKGAKSKLTSMYKDLDQKLDQEVRHEVATQPQAAKKWRFGVR